MFLGGKNIGGEMRTSGFNMTIRAPYDLGHSTLLGFTPPLCSENINQMISTFFIFKVNLTLSVSLLELVVATYSLVTSMIGSMGVRRRPEVGIIILIL